MTAILRDSPAQRWRVFRESSEFKEIMEAMREKVKNTKIDIEYLLTLKPGNIDEKTLNEVRGKIAAYQAKMELLDSIDIFILRELQEK